MNKKLRVFSGIQPSGDLHLGNYIGALSQWAKHQDEYENYFCVVDLHAITVEQDPEKLHQYIRSNAAWYIACGIDPKKSVIFVQSHNKDHAQLGWILNCFTGIGQLERMTQYKDKKGKQSFVSAGLFDYPVLMAADILLYDVDMVPVGEDQKQHIELTRDLAERFNSRFGDTFVLPKYMPPLHGERVMSLQEPTSKMSKSVRDPMGTIDLKDDKDVIRDKIMRAVTDSGDTIVLDPKRPAIGNLATIFMALSGKEIEDLAKEYDGKGYKMFKEDLADVIVSTLEPIQDRYKDILKSGEIEDILKDGAEKAREVSSRKMTEVEKLVGLG